MNFAKRRKRQNHSENSMTKQQKICLLLALEIKYIFYHRKEKNDPKAKLSRRLFHILKKSLCKRKNVQKNRVHIQRNLGQILNKTTFDDHMCIPFFTNDSNLDDLTTATNSTSPHEENTCQRPIRTRRLPNKLREYVVYWFLCFYDLIIVQNLTKRDVDKVNLLQYLYTWLIKRDTVHINVLLSQCLV